MGTNHIMHASDGIYNSTARRRKSAALASCTKAESMLWFIHTLKIGHIHSFSVWARQALAYYGVLLFLTLTHARSISLSGVRSLVVCFPSLAAFFATSKHTYISRLSIDDFMYWLLIECCASDFHTTQLMCLIFIAVSRVTTLAFCLSGATAA